MNEPLWCEKYRPKKIADCVLPDRLKDKFSEFVKSGIPNLLLSGKPGVGKTTVAKAMIEEVGSDCLVINASLYGNIDTLRTDVMQFASTVSMFGGRKYVILDEADYINPNSTQPALRNFIEEFSSNCGFILTCNYPNRIIEPLRSRLAVVDFGFTRDEAASLMGQFHRRVVGVLGAEGVEFDAKVVAQVVAKYFPDFRKTLNELQANSRNGKLEGAVLAARIDASALVEAMKNRRVQEVRKWVAENSDMDSVAVMRELYDSSDQFLADDESLVQLIYAIGRYQYQAAFVADQEVNLAAFAVEVMGSCKFK